MASQVQGHAMIWGIAALAIAGVIMRPWRLPEAIWAVLGALLLVLAGLLPWADAVRAVSKGGDVYLFLTGMMLLAELARREGVFDHMAARAVRAARGSAPRLFMLVYGVGIVVTVFLSNDATAVVLTPAVYAAAKAARAEPLAYLFVCAFIANAASFVLPISNPANLVVFGSHMPPPVEWLERFTVPSALAVAATFAMLRFSQRAALRQHLETKIVVPLLSRPGTLTAAGIVMTAAVLLGASAFGLELGLPTFLAGTVTAGTVLVVKREPPWGAIKGVSWAVLPLVAGLFVLVESLNQTGAIRTASQLLEQAATQSAAEAAWAAGIIVAVACNLMNNLPAGLIAGSAVAGAHVPAHVTGAVLIGVDLGPNLSVTGSLATILWLTALRREDQDVSAWRFFKLGLLVMPPALVLALAGLWLTS